MKDTTRQGVSLQRSILSGLGASALLAALLAPAARIGHAAGPTPGGTITEAITGAPDCLDPQRSASGISYAVFVNVFDGLFSLDDNFKVQPNLAQKWDVSADGKTVTIQLRHDVRFSNGDPLTAGDVKFSFDRAVNPATKSPNSGSLLAGVIQTQVVDPFTVRLILKTPTRALLFNLATAYAGILDQKALAAEGPDKFCQYPVGTGPYMVQNVGPGFNSVTLVRNPYRTWEPPWVHNQGPAYLKSIVFKAILSTTTQVSELLAGNIDYTGTGVDGTQLPRLQNNAKIAVYKAPGLGQSTLEYNTRHAPFNTVQGRLGAAEAIDRASIAKAAYGGLADPAYSPIPATFVYYDPASPTYAPQYKPADAAKLIAASGAKGLYTLLSLNDAPDTTTAELIQAELGAAGMRVRITPKTVPDLISAAGQGRFDMLILPWGYTPDPAFMFQLYHSSQEVAGGLNFTFYKSAVIDNALTKGASTFDEAQAQAAYYTFQRYMDTNVVVDPLVDPEAVYAAATRIKGIHTGGKIGVQLVIEDAYVQ